MLQSDNEGGNEKNMPPSSTKNCTLRHRQCDKAPCIVINSGQEIDRSIGQIDYYEKVLNPKTGKHTRGIAIIVVNVRIRFTIAHPRKLVIKSIHRLQTTWGLVIKTT